MYSKNLGRFAQLFAWIILSSICYFQSRQASSHAINKKMFGFFCLDSFSTIFQLWLSIYTVPGVMWVATQKMVPIGLDLQKWDFWYIKSWKISSIERTIFQQRLVPLIGSIAVELGLCAPALSLNYQPIVPQKTWFFLDFDHSARELEINFSKVLIFFSALF